LTATFDPDGNNITIGLPISTMMAYAESDGIMEQEYLTSLGNAATYQISGDSMEMRIAERSIVASFQVPK
jgi:heat shock protein HslJ